VPFDGDSAVAIALKQVNEPPVPPSHLNPALPGPLEDAILRALAKDPADRYADADAFIADLEEARRRIVAGTAPPSQATAAFDPVVPVPVPVPYDPAWDTMPPGPLLDEERVREERKWPWVLLVALLLAAAIVGAALLLGGGTKVKVPGVVGKPSAEAATLLHAAGLEVSSDSTQSAQPRGTVIHQDPVAGTSAKKGTTVTLAVSSGPGAKQVPIVDGLGRNAARTKLKAAGFQVGPDRLQASDTVAKDHVISTSPGGGQQLDVGNEVQLLVSTGPEVVPVPAVVGKSVDEASSVLRDAGFDVGVVDKPDDTKDPGTVLAQDPASGTAPQGSTVRLTVARAPDTAVIPDETGEKSADAIAALSGAGFTVKTKSQDVSQTDGDDTVLAQSPAGGPTKKAKKGSTVTITIGHYVAPATTPATTPTAPPTTTPTVP
jgi:beta-lactam-binding protein with PASTA domain